MKSDTFVCERAFRGLLLSIVFLATNSWAQTGAPPSAASELAQRIEVLEKELSTLRNELQAMQRSHIPSSDAIVSGQSVAAKSEASSDSIPTPSTLTTLLGPTSLSGFVDTYYGYNFNRPDSRSSGLRSFDTSANQFSLNLIKLQVDKAPSPDSRPGYRVAFGFGQAINAINGSDPGGASFDQYLEEGFFSYLAPVGKGLQVDIGKFVTPLGAEVIETKDNWNYSRGLLFSYAIPYFHYGIRAKYALNSKYSLSGLLVNGCNSVVDGNSGKTFGLGLGWNATKKVSVTQNYMAGPEQADGSRNRRQLWDTVVTYYPTARLSFMANYDYGRGDRVASTAPVAFWTGFAAYVRYAFTERYSLATRYEYYDDHGGFSTGTSQHINGVTGTFQYVLAKHILNRVEFRHDRASQPTFVEGSGLPVNAQSTITAGLVFTFDSREEN